jgi:hypothetical protein
VPALAHSAGRVLGTAAVVAVMAATLAAVATRLPRGVALRRLRRGGGDLLRVRLGDGSDGGDEPDHGPAGKRHQPAGKASIGDTLKLPDARPALVATGWQPAGEELAGQVWVGAITADDVLQHALPIPLASDDWAGTGAAALFQDWPGDDDSRPFNHPYYWAPFVTLDARA